MSYTIKVLDKKGKEASKEKGFDFLSDFEPKYLLLPEVIRNEQMSLRSANAHTKGKGEVRGGGKKPWKQKGTGRARHGSSRSPIWIGGGVTFGPRSNRNWNRKINKSARISALKTIFRDRLDENFVFELDSKFNFDKTKDSVVFTEQLAKDTKTTAKNAIIVYTSEDKEGLNGFLSSEIRMTNVNRMKIMELANAQNIIFTPAARKEVEARLSALHGKKRDSIKVESTKKEVVKKATKKEVVKKAAKKVVKKATVAKPAAKKPTTKKAVAKKTTKK